MQIFAMQNKLDSSPNGLIYTFALAVALRVVGDEVLKEIPLAVRKLRVSRLTNNAPRPL